MIPLQFRDVKSPCDDLTTLVAIGPMIVVFLMRFFLFQFFTLFFFFRLSVKRKEKERQGLRGDDMCRHPAVTGRHLVTAKRTEKNATE